MIISVTALGWLVSTATLITIIAPIILLILWLRDILKDSLW